MRRACTASLLVRRCCALAPLIAAQPRPSRAAAHLRCSSLRRSGRSAFRAEAAPAVLQCNTRQLRQAQHRRMSGVSIAAFPPATEAAASSAEPPQADERTGGGGGGARSEDVILQYVVLRRDLWTELSWPLGSVVAQACHAATAALWESRQSAPTADYCAPDSLDHMHKVVLEVKGETQLRNLAAKLTDSGVAHKLWIEQPEDFATCLATHPAAKSTVAAHFKKLKLCKGS